MPDRGFLPLNAPSLRAVLVDDEPAATSWLAELLNRHPHVDVVGTAEDATAAERLLDQLRPDVVFVDVRMPRRSGLTVLHRLKPGMRGVVVTAYPEFALAAFEVAAVDYLLKPVTAERLDRTLARLAGVTPRQVGHQDGDGSTAEPEAERIWLDIGGQTAVIQPEEILWIKADENYSRVQCQGQPSLLVRRTLAQWEEQLPQAVFCRVSRSLIVRLDKIKRIRWRAKGGTLLEMAGAETPLTLGRPATRRLKERLDRGA